MKLKLFKILRTALALMGILAFFACSSDDEGNGGGGGGSLTVTAADGKTVLHAGETVQLSVTPADGTITWSSSKTSVGTVSETGLVSIKSLLPASVNLPYTLTITALNAATGAYGTIAFSVEQTWAEQVAIAEAAHKNISLSALNCNDGIDFDENGIVTSMAKEGVTTNTDDAYAYLVYPVEITKNSNITFSAIVNYSATSNSNGPALIMHNGISVTAYRALTDQGIKNILVDDSAKNDLLKTGGNGLTYNSGYSAADLLEKDVLAKVNVANGSITMSYNTADGSKLIANKANNFDTVFADGAKVYLAIGGKTTESMKARNITVTSDGTTYLVTEINSAGLAGLTISDTKIRVNLNGTGKIIANAVKVGGVATGVTVTSANESIATASAAAPNSDGESVITITGTGVGSTTVTITHDTETSLSRTVQVSVDDFNATDSYVSLDCYPASGMTDAYTDGWFRLTFDTAPSLFKGGAVMIYDDATDKLVDTILFADETLTVWTGVNAAVRDQLVYVDGNNLYFMAHYHALEYGKTYFVAVPKKDPPEPAPVILTDIYNSIAAESFSKIAEDSDGEMIYSSGPKTLASDVFNALETAKDKEKVDVVFCIDTTGSMKDDMDTLKNEWIPRLAKQLESFNDVRMGVIFYRDYTDSYSFKGLPVKFFEFTRYASQISKYLDTAVIHGNEGGDVPEAVYEAIYAASTYYLWRKDAEKKIILIGDAEPHPKPRGSKKFSRDYVMALSKEKGINVTCIIIPDDK